MKTPIALALWLSLLSASSNVGYAVEALSFGRGSCGRLEGGEALPCRGENFEAYSKLACVLGRNYLHPLVRAAIEDAYALLATRLPVRTWQYGDTGWKSGGSLWPHRTHQNGLSADFFVPVLNAHDRPARLPISPFERFGYDLDLDEQGRLGELRIDWQAIGQHLLALEKAGMAYGVGIERVILTPDYHEALLADVPALQRLYPRFMKGEAWVRHDEHYHVDFAIPQHLHRPLHCRQ